MSGLDLDLRRGGTFSVALLTLVLAQSCLEAELSTRMHADGSGQFALDVSASPALLSMLQEGEDMDLEDLELDEEAIREIRTALDTIPGIHFDTAYTHREGDRARHVGRFSFDSVGSVQRFLEQRETDEVTLPRLSRTDRTVQVTYHPDTSMAGAAGDGPFDQAGREMALQMVDLRFRYVFPGGTTVDTAHPAAQVTDSTVIYGWDLADMMDASDEGDSLFVRARLPAPSPGPGIALWIALGVIALLIAGFFVVRTRSTSSRGERTATK